MPIIPTDKFIAEIKRSHTVLSYVDLISPVGEERRLPVISGDVKAERSAEFRRSFSCTVVDATGDLIPKGPESLLTPYGSILKPYRGVIYSDGTEEVYPLGVFRISSVSVKDTAEGPTDIQVESIDLARTVSRDKFTEVYSVTENTNVITAIKEILERTFPELEYDDISTDAQIKATRIYDAGDDPWKACRSLASSIGCEIYFDAEGTVIIAPPVDIEALPAADFSYIEGKGNTMTDIATKLADEPGCNGFIVTGESIGDETEPVRGEAWDEDPASATYRFGPYGEVPCFVQDDVVSTDEEAEAVAKSLLNDRLGFASTLEIDAIVNPAYECGQVVEVIRSKSNISGFYAVDSFNVPLGADGSQSLGLRQKLEREEIDDDSDLVEDEEEDENL